MTTRRSARRSGSSDQRFIENLIGGPLTLGAALSGIRESDGESLAQVAARLGISRSQLCDMSKGVES